MRDTAAVRLLALLLVLLGAPPATAPAEVIGRSVEGRELRATRIGDAAAPVTVLAVGSIHGNERAGHAVLRALRRAKAPAGVQLWLVTTANPDATRAGTRQNARGVDLNRNFPRRWRAAGRRGSTYYPGPRAASEPETRALQRLIRRLRPDRTLWFHQRLRMVNLSSGADPAVVRAYARRVGLPARALPSYRGTASSWQNHAQPDSSAFVVELAAGELGRAGVRRHVGAVLAMARDARRRP